MLKKPEHRKATVLEAACCAFLDTFVDMEITNHRHTYLAEDSLLVPSSVLLILRLAQGHHQEPWGELNKP